MNINLNLYKPFSDFLEKLKTKYDSKFEMMNGLSNSNLNFTDFIDNFIKSKTVAETTIDANANSTTRDVEGIFLDYGYKLDEIYDLKLEENRKEGLEE